MEFVDFNLAKKLREKGYPFNTTHHYDKNGHIIVALCDYDERCEYPMPTIPQVLKWLRKKKIVISILPTGYNKETGLPNYYYVIYDVAEYFWKKYEYPQSFETWEECAIDSIKYVLDNLI